MTRDQMYESKLPATKCRMRQQIVVRPNDLNEMTYNHHTT